MVHKPKEEENKKTISSSCYNITNLTEEEKEYLETQLEVFRKLKQKKK